MAKKLNDKQKRDLILEALAEGPMKPSEIAEETSLEKNEIKLMVKDLVGEGLVKIEGQQAQLVPKKKKAAPVVKGKKAPEPEEDDDDDDFSGDDEGDDGDPDEDDFDADDDADDNGGDDDPDEEDEDEAPKKGKKTPPVKGKKKSNVPYAVAYKPIDTLTDDELTERIEQSTEAAEELEGQGFPLVSEMIMRSVARARKQLNRRQQ